MVVEPKRITTQLSSIAQGGELLQAPPTTVCDDRLNNVRCIHIHRQAILVVADEQLFTGVVYAQQMGQQLPQV